MHRKVLFLRRPLGCMRVVVRVLIIITATFSLLLLFWCRTRFLCSEQETHKLSELERMRLQHVFSKWPPDKPKAAIYFLAETRRMKEMKRALASVDRHFNRKYKYPVIIFYEDTLSGLLHDSLRLISSSDVFLQRITLKPPDNLRNIPVKDPCTGGPASYRNMCRFNAVLVHNQSIFDDVEYYWRLDTDAFLTREVKFDIFRKMKKLDLGYGYMFIDMDNPNCVVDLWNVTMDFAVSKKLKPKFLSKWPETFMFYNNFEISRIDFWRSPQVQEYLIYIDALGGIYYKRWGDAPIKSLAMALFMEYEKIYDFRREVGYKHGSYYTVP